MSAVRPVVLLLAFAGVFLAGSASVLSAPVPGPRPVEAGTAAGTDRELIARVLREQGAALEDEIPLREYTNHLWERLLDTVGISIETTGWMRSALRWFPRLLALIVALAALALVGRSLRLRPRRPSPQLATVEPLIGGQAPDPWAQLQEALDRLDGEDGRDGRLALGLLWRALALGLSGRGLGRFSPEVTHREFVRAVRATRPDWPRLAALTDFARTTDRLLYGGGRAPLERVRGMVSEARGLLE